MSKFLFTMARRAANAMITLRPYQYEAIKAIGSSLRQHGRTLFRLPTGGGKTAIFGHIASRYCAAERRVLISVPRRLLVEQVFHRLMDDYGIEAGVLCAGYPQALNRPVQVASQQTLAARMDGLRDYLQDVDLHIIDEAHHATTATTMKLVSAMSNTRLLGVTATPQRLDGKPLNPPFADLVIGEGEGALIGAGYLADYKLLLPPHMHDPNYGIMRESEITAAERTKAERDYYRHGDALNVYRKWASGKRAIAFGYSVEDAKNIAAKFADNGIAAECVHGEMKREEVEAAVRRYEAGITLVLTTCNLIDEGFDVKNTVAILLMAKTQSLTRFMQSCGRGLRPKEDGGQAVIIDMVGNALTHGLPDDERKWSLEPRERKSAKKREAQVKDCKHCYAANSMGAQKCRICGEPFVSQKDKGDDKKEDFTADMTEIDKAKFRRIQALPKGERMGEIKKAKTRAELAFLARAWGYKANWVWHVLQNRRNYSMRPYHRVPIYPDELAATGTGGLTDEARQALTRAGKEGGVKGETLEALFGRAERGG